MRKIRNLHLWIGLFTSLLILIEAVTGLLMLEPALMAPSRPQGERRVMIDEPTTGQVSEVFAAGRRQAGQQATSVNSGQASGRSSSGQQYTTEQANTGRYSSAAQAVRDKRAAILIPSAREPASRPLSKACIPAE